MMDLPDCPIEACSLVINQSDDINIRVILDKFDVIVSKINRYYETNLSDPFQSLTSTPSTRLHKEDLSEFWDVWYNLCLWKHQQGLSSFWLDIEELFQSTTRHLGRKEIGLLYFQSKVFRSRCPVETDIPYLVACSRILAGEPVDDVPGISPDQQTVIQQYQTRQIISPATPAEMNNLGLIYASQRKFILAQLCFEKALDAKPDQLIRPWIVYNFATVLSQTGKFEQAYSLLKEFRDEEEHGLLVFAHVCHQLFQATKESHYIKEAHQVLLRLSNQADVSHNLAICSRILENKVL